MLLRKRSKRPLIDLEVGREEFDALRAGKKRFASVQPEHEIRLKDRVRFRETDAGGSTLTGRCLCLEISYVSEATTSGTRIVGFCDSIFNENSRRLKYLLIFGLFGALTENIVYLDSDRDLFWAAHSTAELFARPPKNTDEEKIYELHNTDSKQWVVGIYDGKFPRILGRATGDDFRKQVFESQDFTHGINAASSEMAAKLLLELNERARQAGSKITTVVLIDHGNRAIQIFGNTAVREEFFIACQKVLAGQAFAKNLINGLILTGCRVARGPAGREHIRLLARTYGYAVFGSANWVYPKPGKNLPGYTDVWVALPDGSDPIQVRP